MNFNSVPAHSFPLTPKYILPKNINPGPGEYTPYKNTLYNEPFWKIGTEKRELFDQRFNNPGPGAYSIPLDISTGPKCSMHSKLNLIDDKNKNNFPGPGTYKPIYKSNSCFYSFGIKNKKQNKNGESTPGPGNYELRTEKDLIIPSSIFGKEKRENQIVKNKKYIPGPGAYNHKKENILTRNPKYTFGIKLKEKNYQTLAPGPGTYNFKSLVGKEGSKITMGLKLDRVIDQSKITPGPGAYRESQINFYLKKPPSTKIGKSKRLLSLLKLNTNPGPGHYSNLESEKYVQIKNPSWKIGTSIRKSLSQVDISYPGVGNYTISGTLGSDSPKFSIRKRRSFWSKIKEGFPGPGQYESMNLNNIYNRSPSWKMGSSTRDEELRKTIKEGFPGPGKYEYNTKLKDAIKYKCKFGIRKRFSNKYNDNYPGPGAYRIPCSFADVSSYSRDKGDFNEKYKFV